MGLVGRHALGMLGMEFEGVQGLCREPEPPGAAALGTLVHLHKRAKLALQPRTLLRAKWEEAAGALSCDTPH